MPCLFGQKLKCSSITEKQVKLYLTNHPQVLEDFLMSHATENYLEDLFAKLRKIKKIELIIHRKHMQADFSTVYTNMGMVEMTRKIVTCTTDDQIYSKIYEIAQVLSCTIDAPDIQLYTISDNAEQPVLSIYEPGKGCAPFGPIRSGTTVAAQVVVDKTPSHIANVHEDKRFSSGIGNDAFKKCHALSVPLLLECGTVYCVVQFIRPDTDAPFAKYEFEFTSAILSWIMACVQKMKFNRMNQIQTALHSFLLDSTRGLFEDMENIDTVVMKIMTFTKDLVNADRCSLFLVDQERKELYADYFDEGNKDENGTPMYNKAAQIRFPLSRGIAGYVAETGQTVNIKDAYKDDRFNIDVDQKTGYRSRNILCMPIFGKNGVLGVTQTINRLNGDYFTQEDEDAFKLFAVYCSLALHYSCIYNIIKQQKAQHMIAMELLDFHLHCPEEEVHKLIENPYLKSCQVPVNFHDFIFCCYDYDNILPQLCIQIVQDSFGPDTFPLDKLCRFTLTVRKNYRPMLYHNWHHGFHVMHALWRMIKSTSEKFTTLEKVSLIIGGLCHDIDHRGYNNEFFKKLKHPLAALYSTSVMEQHHYKQAITILHAEGHEIFSLMSTEDHKEVLELIRKNILGTDLALYFPNAKLLNGLIEKKEFCITTPAHRDGLFSLMMTAADLCAITKPWNTQKKTVELIYEEFYMQGDQEKKAGLQPIAMMDRLNKDDIPKQQLGFIGFICKPMYETLYALIPETKPFLDGCVSNKEQWDAVLAEYLTHTKVIDDAAAIKNVETSNETGAKKTDRETDKKAVLTSKETENKAKMEVVKTANVTGSLIKKNTDVKKDATAKSTYSNAVTKEADSKKNYEGKALEVAGGSVVKKEIEAKKDVGVNTVKVADARLKADAANSAAKKEADVKKDLKVPETAGIAAKKEAEVRKDIKVPETAGSASKKEADSNVIAKVPNVADGVAKKEADMKKDVKMPETAGSASKKEVDSKFIAKVPNVAGSAAKKEGDAKLEGSVNASKKEADIKREVKSSVATVNATKMEDAIKDIKTGK